MTVRIDAATAPVYCQRMIDNFKTVLVRYLMLSFLDFIILKLFDSAAIDTNEMIMMRPFIQFEHGFACFKIIS